MTDRDTITLPRELVEAVLRIVERSRDWSDVRQSGDCAAILRTALAAEQPKPKPEPVAVFDEQMGHPVLLLGSPMLKDKQPLYTAPPDAEALRQDAFRKGFYAGFAATGEGWNGEYPFQDKNRPIAGDPSVEAAIDAAMGDKR